MLKPNSMPLNCRVTRYKWKNALHAPGEKREEGEGTCSLRGALCFQKSNGKEKSELASEEEKAMREQRKPREESRGTKRKGRTLVEGRRFVRNRRIHRREGPKG